MKLIINMGEATLGRSWKTDYTWIEKGKSGWIKNIRFTDNVSLISTFASNGWSFTAVYSKTINGDIVLSYLKSLIEFIEKWTTFELWECLLILDNFPSHQSKKVIGHLHNSGLNVLFLPPYTPELTPVELMFRSLKTKIRNDNKQEVSKFISPEGFEIIVSALMLIRVTEIRGYWREFFAQIRNSIHFLKQNWS